MGFDAYFVPRQTNRPYATHNYGIVKYNLEADYYI